MAVILDGESVLGILGLCCGLPIVIAGTVVIAFMLGRRKS
jgi:hypothetical protein